MSSKAQKLLHLNFLWLLNRIDDTWWYMTWEYLCQERQIRQMFAAPQRNRGKGPLRAAHTATFCNGNYKPLTPPIKALYCAPLNHCPMCWWLWICHCMFPNTETNSDCTPTLCFGGQRVRQSLRWKHTHTPLTHSRPDVQWRRKSPTHSAVLSPLWSLTSPVTLNHQKSFNEFSVGFFSLI